MRLSAISRGCLLRALYSSPMAGVFGCTLWFLCLALSVSGANAQSEKALRVGYFHTISHAHAVVAQAVRQNEQAWFEKRLNVPIEWFEYNAGPSAMEALLAGSIDLSYVGPNPALNLYIKSRGRALKVVSGAARGGSGLVVRKGLGISDAQGFRGRRVATPQFGNTQDVSARAWFKSHGLSITLGGGDVSIIPTTGPDQLLLFLRGDLDGVWAVEPWLSRLELEGGGELLVNEPDALTTLLVASAHAIAERGELVQKFIVAHEELTQWLVSNPTESQEILRRELGKHVGKDLPQELVARSWSRLSFSTAISPTDFQDFLLRAQSVGFLPGAASVEGIVAASGADSQR